VVRSRFSARLQFPAPGVSELSHVERCTLVRCTSPVYAAAVIPASYSPATDADPSTLAGFLDELVHAAALHRSSLAAAAASVSELCPRHADVSCKQFAVRFRSTWNIATTLLARYCDELV